MNRLIIQLLLFFLTVAKVMNEEQRINVCKTSLNQIYTMLQQSPDRWREFVTLARTITTHLDNTTFMQQDRTQEQVWMIAGLQRLAFSDGSRGGVTDIAAWCSRSWLTVQQREPQNIAVLRGLGQLWLARAQPILNRIHRSEGGSSSSGGSRRSRQSYLSDSEQARQDQEADLEAERRSATAAYVEARGFLGPAVEYLERAVTVATAQRALCGELLVTAAEAYMSLGNTSSPRNNQRYFRRAVQLLRAASNIPDYTLSDHLREYLEDGRLLE